MRSESNEGGSVAACAKLRARRVRAGTTEYVLLCMPLRDDPRIAQLTDAELHVVRALVTGASNALVASVRKTSVNTVANQVRAIFAKTGLRSRAELALELGNVALRRPKATDDP